MVVPQSSLQGSYLGGSLERLVVYGFNAFRKEGCQRCRENESYLILHRDGLDGVDCVVNNFLDNFFDNFFDNFLLGVWGRSIDRSKRILLFDGLWAYWYCTVRDSLVWLEFLEWVDLIVAGCG